MDAHAAQLVGDLVASVGAGALVLVAGRLAVDATGADVRQVLAVCRHTYLYVAARFLVPLGRVRARVCSKLGVRRRERSVVGLGEVSEMVDIVRLGLLAGLSFDASLGLYCEGATGEVARRLGQALLSWQTGLETRGSGLLGAARDLGVRELEAFAVAVTQAIELGAPLAETLEGQGRDMRLAHRAEVERQIERAPVKLLIPVGTLILPALLLSILGPLLAASGML